jgi:hypothetical protein
VQSEASANNAKISEANVSTLAQQANTTLNTATNALAQATAIIGAEASATASANSAAASLAAVTSTVAPFLSPQAQYIFTATAGQTTWAVPNGATFVPGTSQVFVNGIRYNRTESYDDSTGNSITFVNPLTMGYEVTVLFNNTVVFPVTGASVADLALAQSTKGADMVGFVGANGTATTVSALASTASGKGAGLVGFQQTGTGAVALNVMAKLLGLPVSPEDFGAVGDGVTDDSAAFIKAAATGRTIQCGPKIYLLNAGFTLATAGQRCVGMGMGLTLLKFVGNFDCMTLATSGGNGGGFEHLKIDSAGMTGGYQLVINWATQVSIKNVRGINGFNGVRLVRINTVEFEGCSFVGLRGTSCFFCDGTAQRSDIVRIKGMSLSGDATALPNGFVVDGFFNTVQAFGLVVLSTNIAYWQTNSASTTVGNFARVFDFEGDLTNNYQVQLDVGADVHFTDPYFHGAKLGDGVKIAAGVDNVSFKGGKITGNYMCGINNNGSRVKVLGTLIGGNSQAGSAQYSGVYCGASAVKFNAIGCETGLNTGVTKMQKYGFEAASGATDCNWIGGSLKDNVTGEWSDGSGGVFGNVNVFGYSGTSAPSTDAYSAQVPSSGSTVTIANNQPTLIISSGATTASLTVVMPPNPRDGQKVSIGTKSAITAFTLNGNTGQTMNNAPTALAAGEGHCWIWRATSSNWYRLY